MRFKRIPISTRSRRAEVLAGFRLLSPDAVQQVLSFRNTENCEFKPYRGQAQVTKGQLSATTDPILVIIPTPVMLRFMFFQRPKDPRHPTVMLGSQGYEALENLGGQDDCTAEIGSNAYSDWIDYTYALLNDLEKTNIRKAVSPNQHGIIIQHTDNDALYDLVSLQVDLQEEKEILATLKEAGQSQTQVYADIAEWQAPRINPVPVNIDFD